MSSGPIVYAGSAIEFYPQMGERIRRIDARQGGSDSRGGKVARLGPPSPVGSLAASHTSERNGVPAGSVHALRNAAARSANRGSLQGAGKFEFDAADAGAGDPA
jgi:hypothetical protein